MWTEMFADEREIYQVYYLVLGYLVQEHVYVERLTVYVVMTPVYQV